MIQGTTVIVVILNGAFFVGADSRVHNFAGNPDGSTCKLVQVGNSIAGVAGLLGDPEQGWRTIDFARDALGGTGSLDDKTKDFIARCRPRIEPLLADIRARAPDRYRSEILRKPFIQAVFIADGELRAVILEPVDAGASVLLKPHIQRVDSRDNQSYLALGHFDNLSAIVDRTPNYWQSSRVADQIRELISVEARANPLKVGGAIAIVCVQGSSISWIDRGDCQ